MPLTTIREAPKEDIFTRLADHQAQTPSTFYNAKPVLHYEKIGIRAIASVDQVSKLPILGSPEASHAGMTVQKLDVWISSENLTLFNAAISTGISIPYRSISLHAIQRLDDPAKEGEQVQGLYMQLDLSDPDAGGEDEDMDDAVELTLLMTPEEGETSAQAVQKMFDAVTNCSNLHPDPAFDGDEGMLDGDGGDHRIAFEGSVGYEGISGLPDVQQGAGDGVLPPPFPGSGGWITAENVGDYLDGDGNWIKDSAGEGEPLGEGAGRTRMREEMDRNGMNGHSADSDESKRPRMQ